MVKALAGYCILTFVLMQILFLGVWCRPFYNYWQVPPDDCGSFNLLLCPLSLSKSTMSNMPTPPI